jgi:hypothetical protein
MQPQVNAIQPKRIATTPRARRTPPCLDKTLPPNEIRMPIPIPIFVFLLCSGRIFNPVCLAPDTRSHWRPASDVRHANSIPFRRPVRSAPWAPGLSSSPPIEPAAPPGTVRWKQIWGKPSRHPVDHGRAKHDANWEGNRWRQELRNASKDREHNRKAKEEGGDTDATSPSL